MGVEGEGKQPGQQAPQKDRMGGNLFYWAVISKFSKLSYAS